MCEGVKHRYSHYLLYYARVVGSSPTIILRDGVSSMAELVKHDVAT